MKKTLEDIKVKRESIRIWQGIFLAVFGCLLIAIHSFVPPIGVIDSSILAAVGEIFALSGASWGFFAYNRRDSAKINGIYEYIKMQNNKDLNTNENGELSET